MDVFFFKQKTAYESSECDLEFRRVLFRSTLTVSERQLLIGFTNYPKTIMFGTSRGDVESAIAVDVTGGSLFGDDKVSADNYTVSFDYNEINS